MCRTRIEEVVPLLVENGERVDCQCHLRETWPNKQDEKPVNSHRQCSSGESSTAPEHEVIKHNSC